MPVFVHEFFCSGAFEGDLADRSLAREGLAMLAAVVEDFSNAGDGQVVTTLDRRLRASLAAARIGEQSAVIWVDSPAEERRLFADLARASTATLVIAPETGGCLLERRLLTDAAGGRFLGPSPEAIELCADKLRLSEHLSRHSIPTIPTTRFDLSVGSAECQFPMVVKPRDGAGSVDTFLILDSGEFQELATRFRGGRPLTPSPSPARGEGGGFECAASIFNWLQREHSSPLSPHCVGAGSFRRSGGRRQDGRGAGGEGLSGPGCKVAHNQSEAILQPFIPGRALSTAALIDAGDGRIDIFPLGEQRLTNDGRFGYRGGRIPAVDLSPVLAAAAVDLVADACRSLPGLVGYVGFDLIASANAPHVRIVEVNPRLTTSYVGYRRLTQENLAARVFSSLVGWDKLAQRAPAHRFAGNNFEDQDGGPAAGGPALSHPTKSIQCVDFDPDGTVRVV